MRRFHLRRSHDSIVIKAAAGVKVRASLPRHNVQPFRFLVLAREPLLIFNSVTSDTSITLKVLSEGVRPSRYVPLFVDSHVLYRKKGDVSKAFCRIEIL